MKKSGTLVLSLVLALSAAACGGNDDAMPDTSAVGTPGVAAAGTEAGAFQVVDVALGRNVGADNRITDEANDFRPNDTIIAVVETNGAATGQALVARWTFEDGQLVEEQTQTVNSTGGRAYTQFKLTKPSGWPPGKYKLSLMLNNNEVQSEEFDVKAE